MLYCKFLPHFVIGMLVSTYIVYIDHSPGTSSLAQTDDANAIRIVVQRLFESYQQKDTERLFSLWSERSAFLAENKKLLQEEFAAYEKISVKPFHIPQIKIDGDKATLRIVADVALIRANMVKATERIGKKNRTIELINDGGNWKVWKFIPSEEDLASAIIAAKTEDERNDLIEKESGSITSDLAYALIRQIYFASEDQVSFQHALAITRLAYKLAEMSGDQSVIAYVLLHAGNLYGWTGTPEKSPEFALEYFRRSLEAAEEGGFKEDHGKIIDKLSSGLSSWNGRVCESRRILSERAKTGRRSGKPSDDDPGVE